MPNAIVSRGGSGIGFATCLRLGKAGWNGVVGDIHDEDCQQTGEMVRSPSGNATACELDVRDFGSLERLRDTCLERFGRIDHLVASAGVVDAGDFAANQPSRIRHVVETNFFGSILLDRAVVPSIIVSESGHVVLLASIAVSTPGRKLTPGNVWVVDERGSTAPGSTRRGTQQERTWLGFDPC